MNIFITGGTGAIGQHVTIACSQAGHQVVLYTRTPDRVPGFAALPHIRVVEGDITDHGATERAVQGCDAVIHLALGWGNDPVGMLTNDTLSTVFLMEAAEKAGVQNFIYTSSTAALGALYDGINETSLRVPDDLYGSTKGASELFLLGFNQYYGEAGGPPVPVKMRRNIIRPGYTFSNPAFPGGASQSDKRFKDMADKIVRGENVVTAKNKGTQFLSSAQIAQAYVKLAESPYNREIFFVLGKNFTSWAQIALWTKECVPESKSEIIIEDEAVDGEIPRWDVSKTERVFGLSFDATKELKEHVAWNVERAKKILAGEEVHDIYHGFRRRNNP
jgi:UDP-glucose 4-epimerase